MLIRHWRDQHDISQRKMAKAIDVHVTTLSQIEHRRCFPSVPVLCAIWKFTGLSADALLRTFAGEDVEMAEATAPKAVARRRKSKK